MSAIRRGEIVRIVGHRRPIGHEIKKDRPWVVLSPDSINASETTVLAAPLSRGSHPYPYRVACTVDGLENHIVLDQLDCFHFRRLRRSSGAVSPQALKAALATLREMFAE
ncbi:MAG: type II toxin-antitoxin system PemK/MazF family toxin [Gemmatimonadota bacterium]|nr:type II toxin-antitoxin system PemK/MazF family toxin [Gemmatimonadota bacterium]